MRSILLGGALALGLLGCGAHYPPSADGSTGGTTAGGGGTTGDCATDTWDSYAAPFFANRCESCHQHTGEFATPDAVMAKESAILGMVQSGQMPQGAPLSSAELSRLESWFGCANPDGGGDVDAGPTYTCVPMATDGGYVPASTEGSNMLPGHNCLQCHSQGLIDPDKIWSVGGTVFTGPDSSTGVQGARVTLTDANGRQVSLTTYMSGNFYSPDTSLQPPFAVLLEANGTTRQMISRAPTGACNTCHQAPGDCGAPGRISPQ